MQTRKYGTNGLIRFLIRMEKWSKNQRFITGTDAKSAFICDTVFLLFLGFGFLIGFRLETMLD